MPHLMVEYSENLKPKLDPNQLLKKLHYSLKTVPGINMDRVKSRIFSSEAVLSGEHASEIYMIHVILAILDGKEAEIKKLYGETLFSELITFTQLNSIQQISLTVEVREMESFTYFKN